MDVNKKQAQGRGSVRAWVKKNRRVLWWPFGGFLYYCIVNLLIVSPFSAPVAVLAQPLYPVFALANFFCLLNICTSYIKTQITLLSGGLVLWALLLYFFGHMYNLPKDKLVKRLVLFIIIIMFFLFSLLGYYEYTRPLFEV